MNIFAPLSARPDSIRPAGVSLRGKILVVDDEPAMRQFIEQALRHAGYEDLLFCYTGTPVPFIARSEQPGLIIMDVMMAGGNGMRALRSLKQSDQTRSIPVILTSGFNVLTLEESAENQPDHVLPKPFTAPQLLQVVAQLLETRTMRTKKTTLPGSVLTAASTATAMTPPCTATLLATAP